MRNNFRHLFFVAICCSVLLSSCITPKRVNYLQDLEQGSLIELENKFEARISTYDELDIYISCMNQDLAKPFNLYQNIDNNQYRHGRTILGVGTGC